MKRAKEAERKREGEKEEGGVWKTRQGGNCRGPRGVDGADPRKSPRDVRRRGPAPLTARSRLGPG